MVYSKIDPVIADWAESLCLERGFTIAQAAWLARMKAPTLGSRVASLMKSGVKRVTPAMDTMRVQVTNRMNRMSAASEDVLFFSSSDRKTSNRSLKKLLGLLSRVKHTLDICNWNISCEGLVELVLKANKKDIAVRVETDSTQAGQDFSKVQALIDAGITVMGNKKWSLRTNGIIDDEDIVGFNAHVQS